MATFKVGDLIKPTGDGDGRAIQTQLTGSNVEYEVYDKDNRLPGTGGNRYEIRATDQNIYRFPHVENGVFEQTFGIRNTLGVDLNVRLLTGIDMGDGVLDGATIWEGTVPDNARFVFNSEKTEGYSDSGINSVFGFVELRMPYWQFILKITALEEPIEGELKLLNVRRY